MMPRSGVKMRFDRSQYEKWHKDNDQNTKVLSEKVSISDVITRH